MPARRASAPSRSPLPSCPGDADGGMRRGSPPLTATGNRRRAPAWESFRAPAARCPPPRPEFGWLLLPVPRQSCSTSSAARVLAPFGTALTAQFDRKPPNFHSTSDNFVSSGTSVALSKDKLYPSGSETDVTHILLPTNGSEASMPRDLMSL